MNSSNHKDYYEVLGLSSGATQQEIKDAYRKLAFQYHPDRNNDDPAASDKMKALNEAYAILSDPAKRSDYDLLKDRYGTTAYEQYRQTHTQEDIFKGSDIDQVLQEFSKSFGFRDADEIFRQFYGPGFKSFVYSRPGFVYRTTVYNPEQANGQVMPESPLNRMGLSGKTLKFLLEKVLRIQIPERGKDLSDNLRMNATTASEGGEVEYYYHKRGETKNLMVRIPPGIQDGQTILLRGLGAFGKAGGTPGDLLLRVRIKVSIWQRIKNFFKLIFRL